MGKQTASKRFLFVLVGGLALIFLGALLRDVAASPGGSVLNATRATSTVVNIIANELDGSSSPQTESKCLLESTFTVPDGMALLITDLVSQTSDSVVLSTEQRGVIFQFQTAVAAGAPVASIHLASPLQVTSGEVVCPFRITGQTNEAVPFFFFASGKLVRSR